jgi:hypothetical protein
VSVRTVKRWVAAAREEREAALAGEPPAREAGAGALGRADPRWAEMALEIMGEHKDESTPGKDGPELRPQAATLSASTKLFFVTLAWH